MAITKNIVDMMGGTIVCHSKEHEGTEFVVTFDFRLQAEPKTIEKIMEIDNLRGLVVDDDMNTCQSVSQMLRQIGMRSEWCTLGKEAIVRTQEAIRLGDRFAVYIIDWQIPDMNGIEIARRIRHIVGDDAPIIILTAYDWSDIEAEGKEAGVTEFVSKPIFPSDLRTVLMKACGHITETTTENDPPQKINFTGKRILLVEDNELNREIAAEILGEAGLTVDEAVNGSEAIDKLLEKGAGYYNLVVMDIQMPVMDGYTAAQRIRAFDDKELASIPIVALSANAFEEDKKKSFDAGMNAHISKPIDAKTLIDTLASMILTQ
jgi:CheY-like chemotaxis protein